jgi:hypothetical protein
MAMNTRRPLASLKKMQHVAAEKPISRRWISGLESNDASPARRAGPCHVAVAESAHEPSAHQTDGAARAKCETVATLARSGARWAVFLGLALASFAPAHAASADGRLQTVERAALPRLTTIDVRPLVVRQRNFVVEAVLVDALRRRGYAVEVGAPYVVRYQAEGTFSRLKGDSSWLRLYGRAGSSSRSTGHLTLRLPQLGSDPETPNKYQISLKLEDQPGAALWEAVALLETDETDVADVARTMVTAALDRWGESYDGPLER